jgi:hypothetical protein
VTRSPHTRRFACTHVVARAYRALNCSGFMQFSATCYYFAQGLTDAFIAAAEADGTNNGTAHTAPPIGLVHTAWGGSTIEQWLTNETIATCAGSPAQSSNQEWHDQRVEPCVNNQGPFTVLGRSSPRPTVAAHRC